jgi:hypothetical protein
MSRPALIERQVYQASLLLEEFSCPGSYLERRGKHFEYY